MDTGGALATVEGWIAAIVAFFFNIFAVIDNALRQLLDQLGVPGGTQQIIILVVAVLFIVAVMRLFGGVFRVILALFLLLFLLHVLLPNLGR